MTLHQCNTCGHPVDIEVNTCLECGNTDFTVIPKLNWNEMFEIRKKILLEFNCIPDREYDGVYSHPDLPFKLVISPESSTLRLLINMEYTIDNGKLRCVRAHIRNLIKAFNPVI